MPISLSLLLIVLASGSMNLVLPQEPGDQQQSWRSSMACGANSVYLLLHSHGIEADYEAVMDEVGVTPKGCSLQDMMTACDKLGLDVAAFSGAPKDLADTDMPVVLHLDHWTGAADRVGHFVLLLGYDESLGYVEYLDPISLLKRRMTVDVFRRQWSGFGLAAVRRTSTLWIAIAMFAGGALLSAAAFRLRPAQVLSA